ncbi:MAG: sigma factor, partial [Actinomycetota bacterium]|nr:sigma factor [Actinomycetota bacterium]
MAHEPEFENLFLEAYEGLVRSLTAVTSDAELAADCVQEAFIKAHARWGRIRRYDNPVTWIRRVAINRARDILRSEARRRSR